MTMLVVQVECIAWDHPKHKKQGSVEELRKVKFAGQDEEEFPWKLVTQGPLKQFDEARVAFQFNTGKTYWIAVADNPNDFTNDLMGQAVQSTLTSIQKKKDEEEAKKKAEEDAQKKRIEDRKKKLDEKEAEKKRKKDEREAERNKSSSTDGNEESEDDTLASGREAVNSLGKE